MGRLLRACARERASSESGLVLVWMALMLTVLLGMAGFAVDLGSWYLRSAKLQRAADAAALAGVVWMPGDPASARAAAVATLQRNGIDTSKVAVTYPPPSATQQFRVQLSDANVPTFFSRPFVDKVTETRVATGEYVTPVPMGSPRNTFGTGNLLPSPHRENFWAAVSGWCSGRENGDLRQAAKDQTFVSSNWTCGAGLPPNPDYLSTGYLYAVDFASTPGTNITIEIYDPGYHPTGSNADNSLRSGSTVTTTFTVYGKTRSPFDPPISTTPLYTRTFPSGAAGQNSWVSLYTLVAPTAGRYYVQVQTAANQANSYGSNGFGLRARPASTPWSNSTSVCTTVAGDPGYSASCPQVHGVEDMSIFANQTGSSATFYLAQVDPVYAGKTMQIDLFDPGEGASRLEILDPNGNPVNFGWTTPCGSVDGVTVAAPSGSSCNSATKTAGASNVSYLDVSGTGTKPYDHLSSNSKYSNRTVSAFVKLPANYTGVYGTKTWWKIRYATTSGTVTDRTTWSVSILGNPVHLVTEK
jgi:Flp pilus assembly protein TadG